MEFQTYEETLQWIHSRLRLGIKPGLKRMEWMMEKLHHPERKLKAVHIGGTNGKGSTVSYLSYILQEAGYTVGTFTSPYIEQFNERISINGVPIQDDHLIEAANVIKPLSDELEKTELGGPTEFEVITAMSIYYFANINPVDIVLYEVGLGGRFDSTNIILPILCVITSIGLDHTNILGETYEEIAYEKAGIIKRGTKVVAAAKHPGALRVIMEQAREKRASLYLLDKDFQVENHQPLAHGERFTIRTLFKTFDNLEISMIGKYQTENAALSVMAALCLKEFFAFLIEEDHIREGLRKTYWPARFEILSTSPLIIVDGAHNEQGIESLVSELKKRYSGKKIKVIFAALRDKKLENMIPKIDEIASNITFVDFDFHRAAKAEELFRISTCQHKETCPDWEKAINENIKKTKKEEILIITGSLYFISTAKPYLKKLLYKSSE